MFLNTDFFSRDLLEKAINRIVGLHPHDTGAVPSDRCVWYVDFSSLRNQSMGSRTLALTERRKVTEHAALCMRMSDK